MGGYFGSDGGKMIFEKCTLDGFIEKQNHQMTLYKVIKINSRACLGLLKRHVNSIPFKFLNRSISTSYPFSSRFEPLTLGFDSIPPMIRGGKLLI